MANAMASVGPTPFKCHEPTAVGLALSELPDRGSEPVFPPSSGDESLIRPTCCCCFAVLLLKSAAHHCCTLKHEALIDLADSSDDETSPAPATTGTGRHKLRGPGGQFTAARSGRIPNTAAAPSPTAVPAPPPVTQTTISPAQVPPPAPAAQNPVRIQRPYIDDDDEMTDAKMFYGDGRSGESPHNFKKTVMQRFTGKGLSDDEKIEALGLGMASGSLADTWFDDPNRTKTSWAALSAEFDLKWPKRAALRRVGQDAIEDLLAEKLKVEDIRKRVKDGGVEDFAHVVWARKLRRIAADIPDAGGLFIGVVVEKMPLMMQDLPGPGTVFTDWAAFEAAVVAVKRAAIVNAQAKEARLVQMTALAKPASCHILTSQQPTTIQQQRYVQQPYPPYPPYLPSQAPPVAPQAPAAPRAPPVFRPDSERLVDLLKNIPAHHPSTDSGRAAYVQDVSDWHARNGGRGPNELRPYPLTPGTAPLDSRSECFNCALLGHMTNDCPNPSMPALEKKWRQIAASIRNRATGGPRRNPPAPTPIQYVSAPYHSDPNFAHPYHPWSLYAPYATKYNAQDQGNGQGSSN
ncbi:hypothetical protein DFH07DRAFT_766712 [Mycena maculata]|uniref:CCHC-type domain-containing protein n=1 Tax=Mycena maculata TaxID=230809 RepID=A0AAD7K4J9_9AGAR|nr:hypothetical protein DFH07DRAFT_766712 [Mycena maculata]